MAATLSFPTLVAGPEVGARGYRVLRRSGTLKLERQAAARLGDFPLLLAQWANRREPSFAALLPLTDSGGPWLLVRGAYGGEINNDTIAHANAILIEEDQMAAMGGRAEALLAKIPPATPDSDFAKAPLNLSALPAAPARTTRWQGLGLAWRDRLVVVPRAGDVEDVLASALQEIDPAVQRGRVRGWATTVGLSTSGGLVPRTMLQLIVTTRNAQAGADEHYLPAVATEEGFTGAIVEPAPTWRAWERFGALAADPVVGTAVGAVQWPLNGHLYPPRQLLALAAQSASSMLDPRVRLDLILRMDDIGRTAGEAFAADFAGAGADAFAALVNGAESAQGAAFYLTRLMTERPAAAQRLGLGTLAARDGIGEWLNPELLDLLLQSGLAEALGEARSPARILAKLPRVSQVPLLVSLNALPDLPGKAASIEVVLGQMAGGAAAWEGSESEPIAGALLAEAAKRGHRAADRNRIALADTVMKGDGLARWSSKVIDLTAARGDGLLPAYRNAVAGLDILHRLEGRAHGNPV